MAINNNIIPGFDEEKDDSLKISLDKVSDLPNCIRIYLNGYIDTYNSNFFQKKIAKVIEAGFINIIFNCTALTYVSSTGIGSFTSFLKMLKPKGGDIVLLDIQPKVYEVFQLLGFAQFFNIKESFEDAIDHLKSEPPVVETVFPKVFACPVCNKNLRATRAGRFRCSECKSIIAIDEEGNVSLG
ncbi:MAG: STAS domain-containing protein [Treponema sp.]|jgi:anti-anti-sigma factor|nr:anti-sigma factor antagonist [Treponema sp.]MEE1058364.1 STAS domain-containing protein [Treponema sp.]